MEQQPKKQSLVSRLIDHTWFSAFTWLIFSAALLTCVICVFIVVFAIDTVDEERKKTVWTVMMLSGIGALSMLIGMLVGRSSGKKDFKKGKEPYPPSGNPRQGATPLKDTKEQNASSGEGFYEFA